MYTYEDIITPIIMHYRVSTPKAIDPKIQTRSKLGINQHHIIFSKEQSVIPKIINTFSNEKVLPQHSILNYKIDLYFPQHKLAIEVDEKGYEVDEKGYNWGVGFADMQLISKYNNEIRLFMCY